MNARRKPSSTFRRDWLPSPLEYYATELPDLVGRGAWRSARCCFHDEHRPSLRVNVESGAFRCMSCAAHGHDVLAFHRLRYRLGFVDAAVALGAMEGAR